jgi:hypothetical protein
MTHRQIPRAELRFDSVRITAWTYAVYCLTLWPVRALDTRAELPTGVSTAVLVICASCAAAAVSATRRRRVGYYFCYAFSVLILAGPPFGTISGWNMLRALRRNRHMFWPSRPRAAWMRRYSGAA